MRRGRKEESRREVEREGRDEGGIEENEER